VKPIRNLPPAVLAALLAATPALAQTPAPNEPVGPAPEATAAPRPDEQAAQAPVAQAPVAQATVAQAPAAQPAVQPGAAQPPAAGAAQPGTQVLVGGVTVEGQEFESDPETGLITVSGDARAFRGTDEIRATRLIMNPRTRQLTAEGNVVIRQGGQELRGTRATYNFDERQGQIDTITLALNDYFIRADQILLKPGPVYQARRARITTCGLERPHYEVYSRVVDIIPDQRFTAQNIGVDLAGLRLATLPSFSRSLRPREGDETESLYPRVGYDNRNGFFLEKDFTLRRDAPVWLDANVRLATSRDPSGGFLAGTAGRTQFVGALFYRDDADNQRSRFLQVSRLPEVGVVWRPNDRAAPGRFLPHQVGGVGFPNFLERSRSWRLAAELSAGFFRQHRGEDNRAEGDSRNGSRLKAQAQAVLPLLKLGPVSLNGLRLMVRQNVYDTGEAFSVFGTGIGKHFRTGNWRFGVDRLDQFTAGTTPFLFDDVELRQEWRPRVEYHTRNFNFSYFARVRGERGGLYDQVFAVSKLFHCIEPRLTYRARRNQISLEVRIAGLSGFNRSSPVGEPRTSEPVDTTHILNPTVDHEERPR